MSLDLEKSILLNIIKHQRGKIKAEEMLNLDVKDHFIGFNKCFQFVYCIFQQEMSTAEIVWIIDGLLYLSYIKLQF